MARVNKTYLLRQAKSYRARYIKLAPMLIGFPMHRMLFSEVVRKVGQTVDLVSVR